jgi:cytochrome c-type biogenesis protein CcmF
MGVAPLLGWRKTTPDRFAQVFVKPTVVATAVAVLHLAFGARLRFPAFVTPERIYDGFTGTLLQRLGGVLPIVATFLCAFNFAVVVQEFALGVGSRRRLKTEGLMSALLNLVAKSRRRYGGYIVHIGIGLMFLGFTGKAWTVDKETSLKPGQTFEVDHYRLTYTGPRMEVDKSKRMVFADIAVTDVATGEAVGRATPAKFIYRKMPESPTTEVSMLHSLRDDLYVVVGTVSPDTKVATFQVHVNPMVSFIWVGVVILILGATVSMWPELALEEAGAWGYLRAAGAVTTSVVLGLLLALTPSLALGQANASSSLHAGSVQIDDARERTLFSRLLCQCGDCPRLPLSTCTCGVADETRAEIRERIHAGDTDGTIVADYVKAHGSAALAVPPNQGGLRAIYLVPAAAFAGGGLLVVGLVRRWRRRSEETLAAAPPPADGAAKDEYDAKLDEELKRLDG